MMTLLTKSTISLPMLIISLFILTTAIISSTTRAEPVPPYATGLVSPADYEHDAALRQIVDAHAAVPSATARVFGNVAFVQRQMLQEALHERREQQQQQQHRSLREARQVPLQFQSGAPPSNIFDDNVSNYNDDAVLINPNPSRRSRLRKPTIEVLYEQPFSLQCLFAADDATIRRDPYSFQSLTYIRLPPSSLTTTGSSSAATDGTGGTRAMAQLAVNISQGLATYTNPRAALSDEGSYKCETFPQSIFDDYDERHADVSGSGVFVNKVRVQVNVMPQRVKIETVQDALQHEPIPAEATKSEMEIWKKLEKPRRDGMLLLRTRHSKQQQRSAAAVLTVDDGQLARLACVVAKSRPAARIQWRVNNQYVAGVASFSAAAADATTSVISSESKLLAANQLLTFTRATFMAYNRTTFLPTSDNNTKNSSPPVADEQQQQQQKIISLDNATVYNTVSIIEFMPTRANHGQQLSCQAVHDKQQYSKVGAEHYADVVVLDVQYKPTVLSISTTTNNNDAAGSSDDDIIVREGDTVTFVCNVDANVEHELQLNWTFNGVRVKQAHDRVLQYTNVSRAFNKQTIACSAGNRLGTSQLQRRIQVTYPPVFLQQQPATDNIIAIDIGSAASLECRVDGNPVPAISWWYEPLPPSNASLVAIVGATGPVYSIASAVDADFGQYTCQVDVPNNFWPSIRRKFYLLKRSAPVVVGGVTTKNLLLLSTTTNSQYNNSSDAAVYSTTLGAAARLECTVAAAPLPDTIVWVHPNGSEIARSFMDEEPKNAEKLKNSRFTSSFLILSQYTLRALLHISSVSDERDFGRYKCAARNSYGDAGAAVVLQKRAFDVQTLLIAGACTVLAMLVSVLILFYALRKCMTWMARRQHRDQMSGGARHGAKRLKSSFADDGPKSGAIFGGGKENHHRRNQSAATAAVAGGATVPTSSSSSSSGGSVSSENVELKSNTNSTQADNSITGFPFQADDNLRVAGNDAGAALHQQQQQHYGSSAAERTSSAITAAQLRGALYHQRNHSSSVGGSVNNLTSNNIRVSTNKPPAAGVYSTCSANIIDEEGHHLHHHSGVGGVDNVSSSGLSTTMLAGGGSPLAGVLQAQRQQQQQQQQYSHELYAPHQQNLLLLNSSSLLSVTPALTARPSSHDGNNNNNHNNTNQHQYIVPSSESPMGGEAAHWIPTIYGEQHQTAQDFSVIHPQHYHYLYDNNEYDAVDNSFSSHYGQQQPIVVTNVSKVEEHHDDNDDVEGGGVGVGLGDEDDDEILNKRAAAAARYEAAQTASRHNFYQAATADRVWHHQRHQPHTHHQHQHHLHHHQPNNHQQFYTLDNNSYVDDSNNLITDARVVIETQDDDLMMTPTHRHQLHQHQHPHHQPFQQANNAASAATAVARHWSLQRSSNHNHRPVRQSSTEPTTIHSPTDGGGGASSASTGAGGDDSLLLRGRTHDDDYYAVQSSAAAAAAPYRHLHVGSSTTPSLSSPPPPSSSHSNHPPATSFHYQPPTTAKYASSLMNGYGSNTNNKHRAPGREHYHVRYASGDNSQYNSSKARAAQGNILNVVEFEAPSSQLGTNV